MADYICRHGESVANKERVYAGGALDSELTETGHDQARKLATEVLLHEVDFTRVVSSELIRAKDTAQPIVAALGNVEYYTDERLNEYDLGVLSGRPIGCVPNDQVIHTEGAEDPDEFQGRVVEAITAWSEEGVDTLFVAHNSVIRVLKTKELGIPASLFRELTPVPNAQLYKVDTQKLLETTVIL